MAWARSAMASFAKMFETWLRTVLSLMRSRPAIVVFDWPWRAGQGFRVLGRSIGERPVARRSVAAASIARIVMEIRASRVAAPTSERTAVAPAIDG